MQVKGYSRRDLGNTAIEHQFFRIRVTSVLSQDINVMLSRHLAIVIKLGKNSYLQQV